MMLLDLLGELNVVALVQTVVHISVPARLNCFSFAGFCATPHGFLRQSAV